MMTTPSDTIEQLAELRDRQLRSWPLARANYEALGSCERRQIKFGPIAGALQYNPAREVSTGARVDASSIGRRPCFLCAANRPAEQEAWEILPGWELLVNPFPIFPLHFTIAHKEHVAQEDIPIEMASMAEKLPGMAIFFNGAKAGASAPDHRHCQAVMKSELPLLVALEKGVDPAEFPFKVDYNVIRPDCSGLITLHSIASHRGVDATTGHADRDLVNAFMWIGDDGLLRSAVVERAAHRPGCYPSEENPEGHLVSPGAIDMAGIIVLPRLKDFQTITQEEIDEIYGEVGIKP